MDILGKPRDRVRRNLAYEWRLDLRSPQECIRLESNVVKWILQNAKWRHELQETGHLLNSVRNNAALGGYILSDVTPAANAVVYSGNYDVPAYYTLKGFAVRSKQVIQPRELLHFQPRSR